MTTTTPMFHKDGIPYVVDGVLVVPPKHAKRLSKQTIMCDKQKDISSDTETEVMICS